MPRKLFEITARAYAYAETEEEALDVFEAQAGFLDGVAPEAQETDCVDDDWMDCVPYGNGDLQTCREIFESMRAANDAATPDPSQLTLEIPQAQEHVWAHGVTIEASVTWKEPH